VRYNVEARMNKGRGDLQTPGGRLASLAEVVESKTTTRRFRSIAGWLPFFSVTIGIRMRFLAVWAFAYNFFSSKNT
jgi:hypothetical protein